MNPDDIPLYPSIGDLSLDSGATDPDLMYLVKVLNAFQAIRPLTVLALTFEEGDITSSDILYDLVFTLFELNSLRKLEHLQIIHWQKLTLTEEKKEKKIA